MNTQRDNKFQPQPNPNPNLNPNLNPNPNPESKQQQQSFQNAENFVDSLQKIPNYKRVHQYFIKNQVLDRSSLAQTFLATLEKDQSQIFACKILSKKKISEAIESINTQNNNNISNNSNLNLNGNGNGNGNNNLSNDKESFTEQMDRIIEQYKQELLNWKQLQNPYCIAYYDFAETSKNLYVFLEFCDSKNLEDVFKFGKLNIRQSLIYMKQLINGLFYMNESNIPHKSIKPQNILIHKGQAKIAEPGLSKFLTVFNKNSQINQQISSPFYSSPQILQKEPHSLKSDVWSLGVLFYKMIYNKLPWDEIHTNQDLVRAIHTKQITYPDIEIPQIKQLIQGMLVISEEYRYNVKSCKDLVESIPVEFNDHFGSSNFNSQYIENPTSYLNPYLNYQNNNNNQNFKQNQNFQDSGNSLKQFQQENDKLNQHQEKNHKIKEKIEEKDQQTNQILNPNYQPSYKPMYQEPQDVSSQSNFVSSGDRNMLGFSRDSQSQQNNIYTQNQMPQQQFGYNQNFHYNNQQQNFQQNQNQYQYQGQIDFQGQFQVQGGFQNNNNSNGEQIQNLQQNQNQQSQSQGQNQQQQQQFFQQNQQPNKNQNFYPFYYQQQQQQCQFYDTKMQMQMQQQSQQNTFFQPNFTQNFPVNQPQTDQYIFNQQQQQQNRQKQQQKFQSAHKNSNNFNVKDPKYQQYQQMNMDQQESEQSIHNTQQMNQFSNNNSHSYINNDTNNINNQNQSYQQQNNNLSKSQQLKLITNPNVSNQTESFQIKQEKQILNVSNQQQRNNSKDSNTGSIIAPNSRSNTNSKDKYQKNLVIQNPDILKNQERKDHLIEAIYNNNSYTKSQIMNSQEQQNSASQQLSLQNPSNESEKKPKKDKHLKNKQPQPSSDSSEQEEDEEDDQAELDAQIKTKKDRKKKLTKNLEKSQKLKLKRKQKQLKHQKKNLLQLSDELNNINDDNNNNSGDIYSLENKSIKKSSIWKQSRHKNIWTNFGKAIKKIFVNHPVFQEHIRNMITQKFQSKERENLIEQDEIEELVKQFYQYVEDTLKLNRKLDFRISWTIYEEDDPKTQAFKYIMRFLCELFFKDYALQYLLNSRMKDYDVHIKAIPRMLSCLDNPKLLIPEGGIFRGI